MTLDELTIIIPFRNEKMLGTGGSRDEGAYGQNLISTVFRCPLYFIEK